MAITNTKEMAKHLRHRIKVAGIKAGVSVRAGSVRVNTAGDKIDNYFTADEIRKICEIALVNRMTFVKGAQIDPDHESLLTGKQSWFFYLPA